jgi:hypothetical protein
LDETGNVERTLLARFSFGARLPELRSIALVVAHFAGLKTPSRDARRTYASVLQWFNENWPSVSPWVERVQLRDEHDQIVDAGRELYDRCRTGNPWF